MDRDYMLCNFSQFISFRARVVHATMAAVEKRYSSNTQVVLAEIWVSSVRVSWGHPSLAIAFKIAALNSGIFGG
jgi:hypothetical protein